MASDDGLQVEAADVDEPEDAEGDTGGEDAGDAEADEDAEGDEGDEGEDAGAGNDDDPSGNDDDDPMVLFGESDDGGGGESELLYSSSSGDEDDHELNAQRRSAMLSAMTFDTSMPANHSYLGETQTASAGVAPVGICREVRALPRGRPESASAPGTRAATCRPQRAERANVI